LTLLVYKLQTATLKYMPVIIVITYINRLITSPQSNLRRARRKGPTGHNGTPQVHPKICPFPFDDHHSHLIHPSRDRPLSPPQTTSGSNQPFCHSSLLRTERWDKRIFCTISAPLAMLIDSDALILQVIALSSLKHHTNMFTYFSSGDHHKMTEIVSLHDTIII